MGDGWRGDTGGGFTTWLACRTDEQLATLLCARPDLVSPVPADVRVLAARATTRLSLERALDELDQFALHVLGALVALPGPVTAGGLLEVLTTAPSDQDPREPAGPGAFDRRASAEALGCCLARLRSHALVWDTCAGLRPAPGLHAALGANAASWQPGGARPQPPPLHGVRTAGCDADHAAASAALGALRAVHRLLCRWETAPPPVLKSGGLSIRELRQAAAFVGVDLRAAALYCEIARAAGLLAASSWTGGEWLPTRAFDRWRDQAAEDRWVLLAGAWLATTRVPGLVGVRDEHGRLRGALGMGLDRMDAPWVRSSVLGELATTEPGESVDDAAVLRRLAWRWPRRRHALGDLLAQTALAEAALLGLTGLGALSAHGRAMTLAGPGEAAAALAAILPEPVRHVLLQGDLTAVAPGPLTAELEREVSLAADVESAGAATVYRFSAASVRRALDAGRSGQGLLGFLTEHSRTPVPQPLRYLIEDVARRHGQIRAGTAGAYVRCDDPAVLAEIAADRRAARLRLRLLAPTVLISPSGRGDVLATLRDLGYAPAAESADGTVEITAASRRAEGRSHRYASAARSGPGPHGRIDSPWPAGARALAAVRILRAGAS